MGYQINQLDSSFFIAAADKNKALFQVKEKLFNYTRSDNKDSYCWISNDACREAETLEELLAEWRYICSLDKDNNIIGICFEGEKAGDETTLFKALAPYVESGSFIEMQGEDGEMWRECFSSQKHTTNYPHISW